jgi:predicted Holliday junction resolvase-like endonuclease
MARRMCEDGVGLMPKAQDIMKTLGKTDDEETCRQDIIDNIAADTLKEDYEARFKTALNEAIRRSNCCSNMRTRTSFGGFSNTSMV